MDVWFDSGAMPLAQWHYPFENREIFAKANVADYICEAVDQTRGWFYTLHAVSTMLYGRPAFKNVICLGHILDEKGFKMSKSRGNIIEPATVLNEHGADALRWYLYTCTAPGNPRRFSSSLVGETVRKFMLTLWNTYSFFVTYANLDGWTPKPVAHDDLALIDQWALSQLQGLVREVTTRLDRYEVTESARAIEGFVDRLSNWYLRRNRRRFWKSEADADKQAAYSTLYTCLLTVAKLMAPFAPFISEEIYRNLTAGQDAPASVHLADWPREDASLIDAQLDADMGVLLKVVELGRAARSTSGLKIRQPLAELLVHTPGAAEERGLSRFLDEVRDELNVKAVRFLEGSNGLVQYHFKPNLPVVGRKYGKLVPALRNALQALDNGQAQAITALVKDGKTFMLQVAGQTLELNGEDILIETSSPAGFAVAEEGGYIAALNTNVTEALRREGLARDLVRCVQDGRKEAGLQISDHIHLYLELSAALSEALAPHLSYLKAETLADEVTYAASPAESFITAAELGGEELTIGIVKRECAKTE
jgi:isoleucyl-tRNA synthetase